MTLHKYNAGDFTLVQNRFFDEYMISANGEFVKIYLYLLRCSEAERELSLSSIADAFNHTESDVKRALAYWEKQNLLRLAYSEDGTLTDIILADSIPERQMQAERLDGCASRAENARSAETPARRIFLSADRKRELAAQEDVRDMIYVTEKYLGKQLTSTEVTNLLYFYDELHFSTDLIEYLVEYCVSKGKRSISYIRAVALEWAAKKITTVAEAKKDASQFRREFYAVLNEFGVKDRGPAQMEADMMTRWFDELKLPLDVVLEACRRTVARTHAPNFQYADKILASWSASGVQAVSDIAVLDKPAASPAKKPARGRASSNRFNNFPQRRYDYEQLEKYITD